MDIIYFLLGAAVGAAVVVVAAAVQRQKQAAEVAAKAAKEAAEEAAELARAIKKIEGFYGKRTSDDVPLHDGGLPGGGVEITISLSGEPIYKWTDIHPGNWCPAGYQRDKEFKGKGGITHLGRGVLLYRSPLQGGGLCLLQEGDKYPLHLEDALERIRRDRPLRRRLLGAL